MRPDHGIYGYGRPPTCQFREKNDNKYEQALGNPNLLNMQEDDPGYSNLHCQKQKVFQSFRFIHPNLQSHILINSHLRLHDIQTTLMIRRRKCPIYLNQFFLRQPDFHSVCILPVSSKGQKIFQLFYSSISRLPLCNFQYFIYCL